MGAPKGNKYAVGTKLSPEEVAIGAEEYFKKCDNTKWFKNEAIKSGDRAGEIIQIPVSTPYTIRGLCVHLGITRQTFLNYDKDKKFFEVCTRIRDKIETNQVEGAVNGSYNASIVARLVGLADKPQVEQSGSIDVNISIIGDD